MRWRQLTNTGGTATHTFIYIHSPDGALGVILFRMALILWSELNSGYQKSNRRRIETILHLV